MGCWAALTETRCKFPGAPAHSTVSFSNETLSTGTIATYTCERGFELLGPARRVCESTSEWLPEGIPFCGEFTLIFPILTYSKFYCTLNFLIISN